MTKKLRAAGSLKKGESVVMTLKDFHVLEDHDDVLVSDHLADKEKKDWEMRKRNKGLKEEELSGVLSKYDEYKEKSFLIGEDVEKEKDKEEYKPTRVKKVEDFKRKRKRKEENIVKQRKISNMDYISKLDKKRNQAAPSLSKFLKIQDKGVSKPRENIKGFLDNVYIKPEKEEAKDPEPYVFESIKEEIKNEKPEVEKKETTTIEKRSKKKRRKIKPTNTNTKEIPVTALLVNEEPMQRGLSEAIAFCHNQGFLKPQEGGQDHAWKLDRSTVEIKEDFKKLNYRFYNTQKTKYKLEKEKKQKERRQRIENAAGTTDTALGSVQAIRKHTKEQGSAFIVYGNQT